MTGKLQKPSALDLQAGWNRTSMQASASAVNSSAWYSEGDRALGVHEAGEAGVKPEHNWIAKKGTSGNTLPLIGMKRWLCGFHHAPRSA
jgi:hypothetical protein